jgi:hypothetical protein
LENDSVSLKSKAAARLKNYSSLWFSLGNTGNKSQAPSTKSQTNSNEQIPNPKQGQRLSMIFLFENWCL